MFLARLAARVPISGEKQSSIEWKRPLTQYCMINIAECRKAAEGYLVLDKFGD